MPVIKVATGTMIPGDIQVQGWGLHYPGSSTPDLFLEWLVRPVWPTSPADHTGHPEHKMKLLSVEVERTLGNNNGFWYWIEFKATGLHTPQKYELLVNYTTF